MPAETPQANHSPMDKPKPNRKLVIVIAFILLVFLVSLSLILLVKKYQTIETKPLIFTGIKPGISTINQLKSLYGEPKKITSLLGNDVFLYPSDKPPFSHLVLSDQTGKITFLSEFVAIKFNLNLEEYVEKFGSYDLEYTSKWGRDFHSFVFLKPGLLLVVDVQTGKVVEIGYFSPGKDEGEIMLLLNHLIIFEKPPQHL